MRDTASGRVRSLQRPVVSSHPSVQGVWDPSMTFGSFAMRESSVPAPAAAPPSASELAAAAAKAARASELVRAAAARLKSAEKTKARVLAEADDASSAQLTPSLQPEQRTPAAPRPQLLKRAAATTERRRRTLARFQASLDALGLGTERAPAPALAEGQAAGARAAEAAASTPGPSQQVSQQQQQAGAR
jgi:hypothetical protein